MSIFLEELRTINLWSKKPLELSFSEQVTFLTGINGSGKSSILNIIYDSLNLKKGGHIATSKNRLWVSECLTNNDALIQTMILPPIPESQQQAVTDIVLKYNNLGINDLKQKKATRGLYDQRLIHEIEDLYEDTSNLNHVVFSKENVKGQGYIHGVGFPTEFDEEEAEEARRSLTQRPNAFLFQEDRKVMHNLENSNLDQNLEFWETYSSSIDTRFFYIRDAMQIRESQIDAKRSQILDDYELNGNYDGYREDEEYVKVLNEKKAIFLLFETINTYFESSGKILVKDSDNKATLGNVETGKKISWHLLSRGEKTLIYLFFSVYLYKEKVSLFLLDEPDVALHVTWQEDLVRDLVSIAPQCQFIIATHSPSLVMNGWMNNCKEICV